MSLHTSLCTVYTVNPVLLMIYLLEHSVMLTPASILLFKHAFLRVLLSLYILP